METSRWERKKQVQRQYVRRHPERTALYQIVSSGWEQLKCSWGELFEHQYGVLRDAVSQAFTKFQECGILLHGCARAHCTNPECKHSELIAFSCKRRCLCSSCDAKRALLFAEKLEHEVLLKLPHRHGTFTIPKRIRPFFKFDRKLLGILYRAAWGAWQDCVQELYPGAMTGAVMAVHTAGDLLAWHPHVHALLLAVALMPDGTVQPVEVDPELLQKRFADKVLAALVEQGLLTEETVELMNSWPHSGFSAHLGEPIAAEDTDQRLFVARYLKKSPVSNERLSVTSFAGEATVHLKAVRDGESVVRNFSILEFLAELQQHTPDVWEQTSRFYGVYSCRSRGAERQKAKPITAPHLPEKGPAPSPHWAACMKRVFELEPLQCPRCGAEMKIKAFITDPHEIQRIAQNRGIPTAQSPPTLPVSIPLAA